MNKQIELQDLGLKDYKQTWDYQEELFKSICRASTCLYVR